MKRSLYLFVLIILNYVNVNGQDLDLTGTISEKLAVGGIPGASITVLHNGSKAYETSSDKAGNFKLTISLPVGDSILIIISSIGYQQEKLNKIVRRDGSLHLGTIKLSHSNILLKTVDITDNKRLMETIQGGYKINADKMPNATSGSAIELLGQIPGVYIDPGGNVLLRGTTTKIFINGKPTNISGVMLQSLLRSQSGKGIESVVVYTDPPSKFDAAGSGGIIDIILKANHEKGVTGFLSTAVANLPATDLNTNLSFRNNKISIYSSGSVYYREGMSISNNNIIYKNLESGSNSFVQKETAGQRMGGYYGNVGVDYQIDSTQAIGSNIKYIDFNGRYPKYLLSETGQNNYVNNSYNQTNQNKTNNNYNQTNQNKTNNNYILLDVNYRKKFVKSKATLDIDLNYANAKSDNAIDFSQNFYNGLYEQLSIKRQQDNLTTLLYNFSTVSSDFIKNYSTKTSLNLGVKSTFASNDNGYVVQQSINDAAFQRNDILSQNLDYSENINSIYVTLSSKIRKISWSAGFRTENTNYSLHSDKFLTRVNKSYFSFFPNIYAKVNLTSDQQLSINLSRRIERPSYDILNPFIDNSNPNELYSGNPYLSPSYSNKAQINYTKYWDNKHSLMVSAYTTYIDDIFGNYVTTTPDNVVLNTYENYLRAINYGVYISEESSLGKFTGSFYFGVRKNNYKSSNVDSDFFIENPLVTYESNAQISYKLNKIMSFQVSGDYKSKSNYLQVRTRAVGTLNASLDAKINKKLSCIINIVDILKTSRSFTSIENETISGIYRSTSKSRFGVIRFNYRFGTTISNRKRVEVQENSRYKSN